jgi:two-component sensor histidine kinase
LPSIAGKGPKLSISKEPDEISRGSAPAAPRIAPVSVVALLGLLLAAAILPALAFSGFLLRRTDQAQQETVATLAEATAGAAVQTIDRQVEGMLTTLRSLGTAQSLERENLEQFYRNAVTALAGTESYAAVVDDKFRLLLNTRQPFGEELGKISDVGPLRSVLESGQPFITGGAFGEVAQQWVFSAILPWKQPGKEPLLLVMTQNAKSLTETLAMENLRGGWSAVIIDRAGVILASTMMSSDVGKPFFLNDLADPEKSFRHEAALDGKNYEVITKRSDASGWRVAIWAESGAVLAPMYRTFRLLLLGGVTLIAMGSFAAWIIGRQLTSSVRQLAADAQLMGAGRDVPARTFPALELSAVSAALSAAAASRRAAENEIKFLMREVAHRSKNQMAVVASLAKQTALSVGSVDEFDAAFQRRLQGLARSTDLLIAGSTAGVDLEELVRVQVAPFRPIGDDRLSIGGPQIRLSSQAAQTLGLVFHEKATNASKYGAFSDEAGQLSIRWARKNDNLELVWRETMQQASAPVERRGFGTRLVDRVLKRGLGAQIERTFHPNGLESRISIPISALTHIADS